MKSLTKSFGKMMNVLNIGASVGLILIIALFGLKLTLGGVPKLSFNDLDSIKRSLAQSANEEMTSVIENSTVEESSEESGERTVVLGDVGLNSEQMKKVATNIFYVANNMTEIYSVSDGLTLVMYVLRYMAEIGEYEMAQKDILILVDAFEKLAGMEVGPEVEDVLAQIRKVKFGRKDGQYFARIFALNTERGIIIPINEKSEEEGSLKEIIEVVVEDGSSYYFEEVTKTEQIKSVKSFIREPVKILGVLESIVEDLNQIHPDIERAIDRYFLRDDLKAPPMIVKMDKIYVRVDTSTMFNEIKFKFNKAVTLPSITKGEEASPVPSFILGAKAKLLHLKVSVDE